jgi:hypothetical protein
MIARISTYVLAGLVGSLSVACSNAPASLGQYDGNSEGTGGNSGAPANTGGSPGGNTAPALGGGSGVIGGIAGPGSTTNGGTGTTAPLGLTCPLLDPTSHVFYPGDASSPCPVQEPPTDSSAARYCSASLSGVRCAYPAPYPDGQDIWTCTEEGGTLDPYGRIIPGTTVFAWEIESKVCKRTGNDCTLDNIQPSDPRTPLTTTCESRAQVTCPIDPDTTAQTALDFLLTTVLVDCLGVANLVGASAALSVWFEGDCAKEFVAYPSLLNACVQKRLEAERYDCSSGLVCGATGLLGGCDLC